MDGLFALTGEPATLNDFDWRSPMGSVQTSIESLSTLLSISNAKTCLRVGTQARLFSWSHPLMDAELFARRFVADLPADFPQADVLGMVWRIKAKIDLPQFKVEAEIQGNSNIKGTPDTGECLDAMTWMDEKTHLTLGTEDAEALAGRAEIGSWFPQRYQTWLKALCEGRESTAKYPVVYGERGLSVLLPNLQNGEILQIHFVAAWARPDQDKPASWFAADTVADAILKVSS